MYLPISLQQKKQKLMLPLHPLLLLFFSLLLPSSLQQQQSADGGGDLQRLLEFKKGIVSDPYGAVLPSWTASEFASSGCPSSWHGVTCDATGASVAAVSLDGLGLAGEIKLSTLLGMMSLENLTLSNNNLTGRLPPMLGSMVTLRHLDLSRNRFYGPVPEKITGMSSLEYLNLSFNNFSGGVPPGFQNLQGLAALDLRSNSLQGSASQLLVELRNAEYVDLSCNGFGGELWVRAVDVGSLGNKLRYMNLSYNGIQGRFFSGEAISTFRSLEILDASHNQLSGKLPEELFGSFSPLVELDLSVNQFSGPIYNITSTNLRTLNLSNNALSDVLPSTLGSSVTVDFSDNMISGDLSSMQSWGAMLEVLDLSSNSLSGDFTGLTMHLEALTSIKIRNNSLKGSLPSAFERYRNLSTIDLSSNKLGGSLFPGLFSLPFLTNLNLSANLLTGVIPLQSTYSSQSLGISSYQHMESLDLSDNYFSGPLPPDIISFQNLRIFSMHNNSVSGVIPREIGKLKVLEFLDLSSNHFNGSIPDISQSALKVLNVSYNDLSGPVPQSLRRFPFSAFHPGNVLLLLPDTAPAATHDNFTGYLDDTANKHRVKSRIILVIIICFSGTAVLVLFIFILMHRMRSQEFNGRSGFKGHSTKRDSKIGKFASNIFWSHKSDSISNTVSLPYDQLLNSTSKSRRAELESDALECELSNSREAGAASSESATYGIPHNSSPGSLTPSHMIESTVPDQNLYSPDRLVGELVLLDNSFIFTAEDLSRAPAEILGRSSHGTSYKAMLGNGHVLTVKWLRVGLVKRKKDFAKEVKRLGTIKHSNLIPLRGFYWGPREQERLLVSDYVIGDSLALHLHEATPRRYERLTFSQRLNIAIDVARCLRYLHQERSLPHGNLKPTNILLLLSGHTLTAQLTDYCLHHLMTSKGISEQMLNLGALGYRAPELEKANKPVPSLMADVYAFGVILLEMLTRRSAGDIISGQSGAVDLTDWVRKRAREGRVDECLDSDIASLGEARKAMEELLAVSLRCILPVNERPNIGIVFNNLCRIVI